MNPADAAVQERVDRLFDRFERMSDAEFVLMRSVWNEVDATARQAAWATMKVALRTKERERMLNDARNRIAAWVNNHPASLSQGDTPVGFSRSGMDANAVRTDAIPPMLDAIAATIADRALSPEDQALLMEPVMAIGRGFAG